MPKVSKDSASQAVDHGPVIDRSEQLDGYTVNFVTFRQDIDATPLLKGLPNDRCHCPHWGYVIKGRLVYRFGDHEEVFEAGDAFYAPPGHVPVQHEPGTEIVQFSPTEELREVETVMARNMQAMLGV
jgi:mannose-6-phosphate isomerase-like protein (cupin superfamily)